MDFIINSQELLNELSSIKGVILSKNVIPILDNYLFKIDGNTLTVSASDLETFLSTKIILPQAASSSGSICVNAKKLNDILSMLKSQEISLSFKDNLLEIKSKAGKYKIPTVPSDEFPKLPDVEKPQSFSISSTTFQKGLNTTTFAADIDSNRPILSSIHIDTLDNSFRITATDTHKLSRYSCDIEYAPKDLCINLSVRSANLLSKLLSTTMENVSIEYNDTHISITNDTFKFISRQVEGNFPNCDRVIPTQFSKEVMFTKALLCESIKRVSYFANPNTNMIKFDIKNNTLELSAQDFDMQAAATESININPSTTQAEPVNITIGFKSKFIIEILDKLNTDEVIFKMNETNNPAVIIPSIPSDNESYLMLCMPMMLN